MTGSARTLLLAAALLAAASGAQAQDAMPPASHASPAPAAGPALDAASVGVRMPVAAPAAADRAALAAQQGSSFGRGQIFMIVGGAALITGLVIGDDAGALIAVGGAAVGLYGLYIWLQTQ